MYLSWWVWGEPVAPMWPFDKQSSTCGSLWNELTWELVWGPAEWSWTLGWRLPAPLLTLDLLGHHGCPGTHFKNLWNYLISLSQQLGYVHNSSLKLQAMCTIAVELSHQTKNLKAEESPLFFLSLQATKKKGKLSLNPSVAKVVMYCTFLLWIEVFYYYFWKSTTWMTQLMDHIAEVKDLTPYLTTRSEKWQTLWNLNRNRIPQSREFKNIYNPYWRKKLNQVRSRNPEWRVQQMSSHQRRRQEILKLREVFR